MLQAVPVPGGAALPRVPALLAGVRRPALPRPQAGGVAVPRSDHARRQGRGRACRLQGKEGRGDFTLYLHVFGKNVYWKKNSQGHLKLLLEETTFILLLRTGQRPVNYFFVYINISGLSGLIKDEV